MGQVRGEHTVACVRGTAMEVVERGEWCRSRLKGGCSQDWLPHKWQHTGRS
jgi:hypothetical protein